jgi:hypothetical protein
MKKIILAASLLALLGFTSCKKENTTNDKVSVNKSQAIDTLKLLTNNSVKVWKCVSKITCGSHSCPNHQLPEINMYKDLKLDHVEYDFDGKCGQTHKISTIIWQLKNNNILSISENEGDLIDRGDYTIAKVSDDSLHLKWYTKGCSPNQSVLQESFWVAK